MHDAWGVLLRVLAAYGTFSWWSCRRARRHKRRDGGGLDNGDGFDGRDDNDGGDDGGD